jgi:uncharacterized membrane protein YccC
MRRTLLAVRSPLVFGLRLWASVCLAYYIAFWLELQTAAWAGLSAAIVCQPRLGALWTTSVRDGTRRRLPTVSVPARPLLQ